MRRTGKGSTVVAGCSALVAGARPGLFAAYPDVGGYRDLLAYRLADQLARWTWEAVDSWPKFELWGLGIQLVRAAGSVGANIAEADGRWTNADKRHLLLIARGSLQETEHWLELAHARGLVDDGFRPQLERIGRLLNGLIRSPNRS